MKKNVIYGIIALLSVSLFFLGCPTEASDSTDASSQIGPDGSAGPNLTSPGAAAQAAEDALKALLEGAGISPTDASVTVSGSTVTLTLTASVALDNLEVSPGTTLAITGDTLTVSGPITNSGTLVVDSTAGLTLVAPGPGDPPVVITNTGTIQVEGPLTVPANTSIVNSGNITVDATYTLGGTIDNTGTIVVPSGGTYDITNTGLTGTNGGTIIVEAGGKIKAGGSNLVNGNGLHIIKKGGEAYYNNVVLVGDSGSSSPIVMLTDSDLAAEFSYNNAQYNLKSDATVTTFQFAATSNTLTLTIASGKILTISGTVVGSVVGQKIVNNGTITVSGTSNFYENGNSTAESSPGAYTYTWVANAGGSASAGWERP
jgi:hypothetical protein